MQRGTKLEEICESTLQTTYAIAIFILNILAVLNQQMRILTGQNTHSNLYGSRFWIRNEDRIRRAAQLGTIKTVITAICVRHR